MELNSVNTALLRECRELVTNRIQATVARAVDDTVVALERQTLNGSLCEPDSKSFDAVRELRQRRREFALCFEYRFRELFDRRVHGPTDGPGTRVNPVPSGCRKALMEIDRRLETLLHRPRSSSRPSPMEPELLIAAFSEACADVAAGEPVRHALMELFQRHVHSDLPRIYGEVNALLARQGISATPAPRTEDHQANEPFSTFPGRRPLLRAAAQSVRPPDVSDSAILQQIESLLNNHAVPHFVVAFALGTWAPVMARIKTDKGEGSVEWDLALKTLADLITGVESFPHPVNRRLAIWKLPGLVKRLKTGMGSIGISQQDQVLFLKTLRAYHLRVLGQRPVLAPVDEAPDN